MRHGLLLLPLLLLVGCQAQPFSLLTYNAGLAVGFVPGADERAASTAAAVASEGSDVVCLQEVWAPEHAAEFDAVGDAVWDEIWFTAADPVVGPDPACTQEDIDPLLECMEQDCGDACADELPGCLLSSCALEFLGLEPDCMRCAQANVGATPAEVGATCTAETTEYAYDGSFGTGLLSTLPMTVEQRVFESTTNRRSALHAVIEAPGGDIDLFCTHLTAVFSIVPYPREEGSWEEEQLGQVTELRAWVDEVGGDRTVILGDLNTGPAVGTNDAELPDHYAALAEGFDNPYAESDQRCTFCPENGLSSVDSDERGRLIDHVLLRGFEEQTEATRVLDDVITVETCGEEISGAWSDHYGVQVTIQP